MTDTNLKIYVFFVVRNIIVCAHFVTQSDHGGSVCAHEMAEVSKRAFGCKCAVNIKDGLRRCRQ